MIKGWIPDYPDFRDEFKAYRTISKAVEVPPVVYTISAPVMDQGGLGSCVFQAISTMMACVEVKNQHKDWFYFSSLFAYYNYREAFGNIDRDDGAMIRLAFKQIQDKGICRLGLWPYIESLWDKKPAPEAYADAANHQILSYHALNTTDEMMACLSEGYGFVCGISVYESFMDVGPAGIVPLPDRKEKWLGGHAIYLWGYDQHSQNFLGQNSWGTGWGKEGRFTIPFEYLAHSGLASSFWTVRLVEESM